ncbi:MAG: N-succinylarginine dihydrolase, partial [Rickettsiales bacterium]
MATREWQFDGLVGPTHNYAGLAYGNLASEANRGAVANPRAAALQGLEKMRFVRDLGVPQCFIPPHFRPVIPELKRIGFGGALETLLNRAFSASPGLLASVYSSSFMWVANLATVAPSCDTEDGKLHLTPANLVSHYHRALEAPFSTRLLQHIFHNEKYFTVHNYLLPTPRMGDEAAANHMRVSSKFGSSGKHIFVYGAGAELSQLPAKFPARQTREASEAVARLHTLKEGQSLFLQQAPAVIDAGVFHNDVIAMNCTRRMFYHEDAFINPDTLKSFCNSLPEMKLRVITQAELSVADAVKTYFFNAQLLELPGGQFALIVPSETGEHEPARKLTERLVSEGVLDTVHVRDVRESMRNGGGPACLRLRIVMS